MTKRKKVEIIIKEDGSVYASCVPESIILSVIDERISRKGKIEVDNVEVADSVGRGKMNKEVK